MIKKIGILTSGGDAPGMNNAIRAVGRAALHHGLKVSLIKEGFKGLVENKIEDASSATFSHILSYGGTFLKTARLPKFKDKKVRAHGIANLKQHNIDALVVIGGDGSFLGALDLTNEGINCIGIPGTIDNDIATSDYTIGFSTALNTIVEAIDKLKDTSRSHSRCTIVEVMGRHCGDLALHASIAAGACVVSIPEKKLSEAEIIRQLNNTKQSSKVNPVIIVTEYQYDVNALAKKVEQNTKFTTRAMVLGHIQRGGSPSAEDRILASRLGVKAVELLLENKGGLEVGVIENKVVATPIGIKKESQKEFLNELYKVNNKVI